MLQNLGADLENKYTGRRDQWSQRCPKQGGTLKPAVRCVAFVAQSQYRVGLGGLTHRCNGEFDDDPLTSGLDVSLTRRKAGVFDDRPDPDLGHRGREQPAGYRTSHGAVNIEGVLSRGRVWQAIPDENGGSQ
ncbi:Uncharacterised protein [Mycobacteroides abscessus subsp. massiliense]|nr:Uncharacterised protein [Mycobacteroides abscessus subsp. massiliense]